jgi:cytochrome c-type biogenesis protein CcmH
VRVLALALALALAASRPAAAEDRLADPAQEARAHAIFRQVRCVVCQNESIDDSEADLAADLRGIVRAQVRAGRSDAQIRAYLVARYGEFVLLKPRLSLGNALLWLGPFALAGGGLIGLALRRRGGAIEAPLSEEEEARLAGLAAHVKVPPKSGPTPDAPRV